MVIQERDWGKLNTEVPALSFQGYTGKDSGRLRCQMGLEDQEGKEEERTHRHGEKDSHVMMEAETRARRLQAKEPPEDGRRQGEFSPTGFRWSTAPVTP